MNPILLAGLHGFLKGLALGPSRPLPGGERTYANFGAPVVEELVYRFAPHSLAGPLLPKGWTATVFAAHHVLAEGLSGAGAIARFADVLAGGMLYEHAYRRFGLLGSIAAHAAHNTLAGIGLGIGAHRIRPAKRTRRRR